MAGWWGFGKVKDAYFMKDAKAAVAPAGFKNPLDLGKTAGAPARVEGGSIASSIHKSLDLSGGTSPVKPTSSKIVHFKHRSLPGAEFNAGLSALGLVAVVDPVSRTVLIRGPFDAVEEIGRMLESADVVPGWCSVRGWVLWVSDSQADGWDLTAAIAEASGSVLEGALDSRGLVLDVSIDAVSAALEVIKSDSRVALLQEPHVRLLDSTESRIESLEEVPIRSTTVSQGLATASIEYKRVGLEMVLKPQFLTGDRVRLDVVQTGGLVGRSVVIDGADVPVLQTQRVAASVEMSIGQTVILGGVRSSRTRIAKGFLKDTTEIETGVLYVVLALYSDTPRARAVEPDWIPDVPAMVLPAKGDIPNR